VTPASLGPVALEGRLLAPEEARALGLVEAVVPPAVLLEQARGRAAELAALPRPAFRDVKQALRGPVAAAVRACARHDARRWVETAFSAPARERLAQVVSRLTRNRAG
jgi:enoyl-CoA hydratase/carnithine racemase